MVAIVAGFIITVIIGLILSLFATNLLSPTQVITIGVITFIVISPLFGYGVYTYARSTEAEAYQTNEDMEKPRLLLDILRDNGHGDVLELANQLETHPEVIRHYIDDLSQLGLFSGIADWENGMIAMIPTTVIQAIETCRTCQNPISIAGDLTICPHCATEYYTF
ncbi:MAG: hypothetical protein WBC91_21510 [Phototrophicaceae bacterium]